MKQLVVQATIEVSGLIKILLNRKTLKENQLKLLTYASPGRIWFRFNQVERLLSLPNTKGTKL